MKPEMSLTEKQLYYQHLVYVAWNKRNQCVYIGATSFGISRTAYRHHPLRSLRNKFSRVDFFFMKDREAAFRRERELTEKLQPTWIARRACNRGGRWLEYIPLIEEGKSNAEIAKHFGVVEQTVKNNMYTGSRKMKVHNRTELCRVARKEKKRLLVAMA